LNVGVEALNGALNGDLNSNLLSDNSDVLRRILQGQHPLASADSFDGVMGDSDKSIEKFLQDQRADIVEVGGTLKAGMNRSDKLDIPDDGSYWCKYGKKKRTGTYGSGKKCGSDKIWRHYFQCKAKGCAARRTVDQNLTNPSETYTTYKNQHTCGNVTNSQNGKQELSAMPTTGKTVGTGLDTKKKEPQSPILAHPKHGSDTEENNFANTMKTAQREFFSSITPSPEEELVGGKKRKAEESPEAFGRVSPDLDQMSSVDKNNYLRAMKLAEKQYYVDHAQELEEETSRIKSIPLEEDLEPAKLPRKKRDQGRWKAYKMK